MMKIAALAGALALAMTTGSFAQTTGPSGQQDTNKPGMANPNSANTTSGSSMSSDGMKKSNNMGTSGSSSGSTMTTPGSTTGPSGQSNNAPAR